MERPFRFQRSLFKNSPRTFRIELLFSRVHYPGRGLEVERHADLGQTCTVSDRYKVGWPDRAVSIARSFAYAIGFVGVSIGCVYALMWNFEQPPMSQQKMDSIEIGMTKADVVTLIGKPNHTNSWQWVYTRPLAWGEFKSVSMTWEELRIRISTNRRATSMIAPRTTGH